MFCRECGAWLGEEDVQVCKECGAEQGNGMLQKSGLAGTGKEILKAVLEIGENAVGEVANSARADVEKGLAKKGKKMTNTLLKEVGLKPKTPIDIIKKKTKKTIKKLKKK
ncbi:MAG: hypothetical protein NC126_05260 [Clostridium sp.]|nr:hypothetical protein [Clostridium sp.]